LNNIRSLYNVGSVFRTADGIGIEKLWLCGITGYPPQSGIAKTALGAEENVPWEYRKEILPLLRELKAKGYQIVLLEQIEGSVSHDKFVPKTPVCLVVGNEISGISDDLTSMCDRAVEIDMAGIKNSLNVAVAFGIIGYHIRSNILKKAAHQ
jgi:23S rRNA (guanosine2251-2'-O)-methyltransferase